MKVLSKAEMVIHDKIKDIFIRRLKTILEVERRINKHVPSLRNAVELNLEKKVIQSLRNEIYDVFHDDLNWINGGEMEEKWRRK